MILFSPMLGAKQVHEGTAQLAVSRTCDILPHFLLVAPKGLFQLEESWISLLRLLLGELHEVAEQVRHAHTCVAALATENLLDPLVHSRFCPSEVTQKQAKLLHGSLLTVSIQASGLRNMVGSGFHQQPMGGFPATLAIGLGGGGGGGGCGGGSGCGALYSKLPPVIRV